MDEQFRDILLGAILIVLIINTIAIFSLFSIVSASRQPVPSGNSSTSPVVAVNKTANITLKPTTVKTTIPTPTPVPLREGYVNIFSVQDEGPGALPPPILLDLKRPPLVIDYTVYPRNITDVKLIEYKMGSTEYHDNVNITRPYENAWFGVKVTDNDTGEVVVDDGYGKAYGLVNPRHIEVREMGNYTIILSGQFVNLSLSMQAEKEGNAI